MGTLAQCQSGAILLYIAEKYDARVKTPKDRALGAQWVLFASTDIVRARLQPVNRRFSVATNRLPFISHARKRIA